MICEHGKVYKVKNSNTGEIRLARYHYMAPSYIDYPYFYWPIDVTVAKREGSWVEGYEADVIE